MSAQSVVEIGNAPSRSRNIAEVVRMLLAVSGKTARDLAAYSGMRETRLSERLNGKAKITADDIATWADFFEVDPGMLFRDPKVIRDAVLRPATAGEQAIRSSRCNSVGVVKEMSEFLQRRRTPEGEAVLPERSKVS